MSPASAASSLGGGLRRQRQLSEGSKSKLEQEFQGVKVVSIESLSEEEVKAPSDESSGKAANDRQCR